jgi:hypothetical protein
MGSGIAGSGFRSLAGTARRVFVSGRTEKGAELKVRRLHWALALAAVQERVGFTFLQDGGEDAVAGEHFGVVGELH